jgi:hypothetical protein
MKGCLVNEEILMEPEDFARVSPAEPATVLVGLDHHHFGFLKDAVHFALVALPHDRRDETWIVTDRGLFAPEDLPRIAQKLAA